MARSEIDTSLEHLRIQTTPVPTEEQSDLKPLPTRINIRSVIRVKVQSESPLTLTEWKGILKDIVTAIGTILVPCEPFRYDNVKIQDFASEGTTVFFKVTALFSYQSQGITLVEVARLLDTLNSCIRDYAQLIQDAAMERFMQFTYSTDISTSIMRLERILFRPPKVELSAEEQLYILEQRKQKLDITAEEEDKILRRRERQRQFEDQVREAPRPVQREEKPKQKGILARAWDVIKAIFGG